MFGRGVTWRITGGVSALGVLEEGDELARGLSWVREESFGEGRQESRCRGRGRGLAAEMAVEVSGRKAASRGIRQWEEGGRVLD